MKGRGQKFRHSFLRALVLKVENNLVIINLGQNDGLQTGMVLNIYRPSEGANPLKFCGIARITEAGDHYSSIKIVAKFDLALAVGENWMVKVLDQK